MRVTLAPISSPSVRTQLRTLIGAWGLSVILPLPALVAIDPAISADIACVYLGIACAWLVTEFHRGFGVPESRAAWRARVLAVRSAVGVNVAIFITFGVAGGVVTHFPFPLMAALSALPAIGMLPLLLRRMPARPFVALLVAGMLVGACKLAGCVVARIVYGPDYIAQGYVSADWRTAKLMITVLWTLTTAFSLGMLWVDSRASGRSDDSAPPCAAHEGDVAAE